MIIYLNSKPGIKFILKSLKNSFILATFAKKTDKKLPKNQYDRI